MSQPEARLSAKIIKILAERYPSSFWVKIAGSPGQRSLPDIHGTVGGRSVWLETKMPGKFQTPKQAHIMRMLLEAGAIVGVIYSADDAIKLLIEQHPMYTG